MMHPLVINDSPMNHHPYYPAAQPYMKTPPPPSSPSANYHHPYSHHHHHHHPYDTVRSSHHASSNHHHYYPQQPQSPASTVPSITQPSRRASVASPATILSRQRSATKSLRDRRRSSGALSNSSQQQYHKPRRCIGEYYVGKTLGKGASGRVKLGIHKHTGEQVAIKIISKAHLAANPAIEKAVRREIAIMKLIRHPNVMALVDVIDDPNSSDLNLILEYVQGGELFEYLVSRGRLSDAEARRHFQQIILGLDFCHHHLICHRDLKPENLLLDSRNNIKIADFGMASLQPAGSMLETSCGSPHYASPEIVAGMPYNGSASDIWSCGVILYALLTGHLPFDDENIRQLLKKVKAGKYAMPDDISRNAQDLIRRILVVDPSKRLTMDQIMAHPWFCESEPANLATLPVPPTANEIGRPVWDPSEIDDRILETIKFLWGETQDEVIIRALISKEHNMQKVVYVLLQQHSERYWQNDHDDDDLRDNDNSPDRRYQTIGHRAERNRRCMSMLDSGSINQTNSHSRPSVPWMPEPPACASIRGPAAGNSSATTRRYSASTASHADRQIPDFMHPPPLPPLPMMTMTNGDKARIKKSDTFYSRFIKSVLTSRRQSKSSSDHSSSVEFDIHKSEPTDTSTIKSTLAGTLRRKNPFSKMMQQEPVIENQEPSLQASASETTTGSTHTAPIIPTKSTLRRSSVSRNKVDPKLGTSPSPASVAAPDSSDTNDHGHLAHTLRPINSGTNKTAGKSFNSKRLSIRVPSAFKHENGTNRFSFTMNGTRRQRKELDLSMFQGHKDSLPSPRKNEGLESDLIPPPALSDGSTLSSSSSSSSTRDPHQQQTQQNTSNHSSSNDVHSSASTSSASSSTNSPVTPTATHQQAYQFKSALRSMPGKGEFLQSPPPASISSSSSSAVTPSRRESQGSLHSVADRRGSNISTLNRPITPSLLSNSSTITTASGSYPASPHGLGSPVSASPSIIDDPNSVRASWLNNLFFFKQPKICSVVIPETDIGTILCTLHRLINQLVEAKFYEKDDKQGIKRYKAEIKTKHLGKTRQVKCRLEILKSSPSETTRLVQFTQQQGDGIVLASVVRNLQQLLDQEYPTISSAITAGF